MTGSAEFEMVGLVTKDGKSLVKAICLGEGGRAVLDGDETRSVASKATGCAIPDSSRIRLSRRSI